MNKIVLLFALSLMLSTCTRAGFDRFTKNRCVTCDTYTLCEQGFKCSKGACVFSCSDNNDCTTVGGTFCNDGFCYDACTDSLNGTMDCAGDWNGDATTDRCGVCDSTTDNDCRCGDGIVQSEIHEICDDGPLNTADPWHKDRRCRVGCHSYASFCGDGITDAPMEQCDIGAQTDDCNDQCRIPPKPVKVALGNEHSCAIQTDKTITCWGGTCSSLPSPPGGHFIYLAAGDNHYCGIKTNSFVECWGADGSSQSSPPDDTFIQLAAGVAHTCGIKSDGTLTCWGSNDDQRSTPPEGYFIHIAAGRSNTCGIKADKTVACWGNNRFFQSNPPGGTFIRLAGGGRHSCGIKTDTTIECWGGVLGTPSGNNFVEISAGMLHTCGIRSDGTTACSGNNSYGQSDQPGETLIELFTGNYHNCGIKTDNTLMCWGWNDCGQSSPP